MKLFNKYGEESNIWSPSQKQFQWWTKIWQPESTYTCGKKISIFSKCSDCLEIMNILSLPSIRKFNREERTDNLLTDDEESMLMQ